MCCYVAPLPLADITSQTPTLLSLQMFRFSQRVLWLSLGFRAWRTPLSGEEFTSPCPWLPKVQPEVEELEPTPSGPGQQVAEKNELGRLQYSLDYDFQSGQVGVEAGGSFGREGARSSSPFLEEAPEAKLRRGSSHHCPAAGGHRAS